MIDSKPNVMIKNKIYQLIKILDISQKSIADKTGILKGTLSSAIVNDADVGMSFLVKIRDAYGINGNWLLSESDDDFDMFLQPPDGVSREEWLQKQKQVRNDTHEGNSKTDDKLQLEIEYLKRENKILKEHNEILKNVLERQAATA
jgi:transcriptional regulator with XRE-family HTH domain